MARLSGCLDELTAAQRKVLVLRAGVGAAKPHSRRSVARRLDLRVSRVRRIERRGLRTVRSLARDGGCGGGGVSGGGAPASSAAVAVGNGSDLIPPPAAPDTAPDHHGSAPPSGSGDVRGESDTKLPPPLETGPGSGGEPGGLSLVIGIVLILLALGAGFATPHLRARLRSG